MLSPEIWDKAWMEKNKHIPDLVPSLPSQGPSVCVWWAACVRVRVFGVSGACRLAGGWGLVRSLAGACVWIFVEGGCLGQVWPAWDLLLVTVAFACKI